MFLFFHLPHTVYGEQLRLLGYRPELNGGQLEREAPRFGSCFSVLRLLGAQIPPLKGLLEKAQGLELLSKSSQL